MDRLYFFLNIFLIQHQQLPQVYKMATTVVSPYSVAPPCIFKTLKHSPSPPTPRQPVKPLKSVLPATFADLYTPDLLADPAQLTVQGRPKFTTRELVDWELNDTRSLLIVDELRPEWVRSGVPRVIEPGYRVQVLPRTASDEELVRGLVESDIYMEHKFEESFLVQTAEYTVKAARALAVGNGQGAKVLSKPEWRNVIENYLLNLACEAQCRMDFKQACLDLKRHKRQQLTPKPVSASGNASSTSPSRSTSPLLKQALMTRLSTSPEFASLQNQHNHQLQMQAKKVSLSRTEKQQLWVTVQTKLYKRLGLDWQPDELV